MKKISEYYILEKKSKFYSYLYSLDNMSEVDEIINNIKKENKKYSHIVYAYVYDNNEKLHTDKEPHGTTNGILEIIKKNNLNKVLIVVIRYFGGTLLGTGLLSRTYTKSAKYLIKK